MAGGTLALRRSAVVPRWAPDISRDAMLLCGLLVGLAYAAGGFATPVDGVNYWNAGHSAQLYPTGSWADIREGYLFYPPVVAQVSALLQPLGRGAFLVLLSVATWGSFWYCARGWSLPVVVAGIPTFLGHPLPWVGVFLDYALLLNVQWMLAAVAIVVIRRPGLWPVLVLSKLATGVGWWWHVARGEWRQAAIGAGATLAVVAVSFALWPAAWFDFAAFTIHNAGMENAPIPLFPVPLVVRLPTAVALVVWGARTDRPWVIPVATGWAVPALYGVGFLPFWVSPVREAVTARWANR